MKNRPSQLIIALLVPVAMSCNPSTPNMETELLPEQVNCGANRFNAFVSPDESFVIVPAAGMEDAYDGVDYYS